MERFAECFADVPDPRAPNALHDLTEILFIALLACLSGATSCCDMALFARLKEAFLRQFLTLEHGIPSHDTFSRVFRMLNPKAFEEGFRRFTAAFAEDLKITGVVALDGKALRRAYVRGKSHMPPVMVTAWSAKVRLALANVLAPGNNEAAGALQLVKFLQLKGCVVTGDALHCHRDMAEATVERGGDYVLAVKGNQSALLKDAKAAIAAAKRTKAKSATTEDDSHGREEIRTAIVARVDDMAEKHRFPGLAAVALVKCRRGKQKIDRYFLMSRCYTPAQTLDITRQHWSIENNLHWTLDVTFNEDQARNRKDHGPENLAVMRRMALNIAHGHPDKKISLRGKLKRAGWDDKFLLELLQHMR